MLDRRPSGHWDWLFDPEKYGTDEQGRRIVNSSGDVDVVRSEHTMHAVQLPVEPGCIVEIDGKREKFVGFRADSLVFIDPDSEIPEIGHPTISTREGVQHFNTRVRDANEVRVIQDPEKARPYYFIQCEECLAHLPVGGSWSPDTEIECGACGYIQEVGADG